jgi:hypothetical protein
VSKSTTFRSISLVEILGFVFIAAFLWIDETFDLANLFYGTVATPTNYAELMMETILVACLGAMVVAISMHLEKRIEQLESLFTICIACDKVCVPGADQAVQASWREIDLFTIERVGSHVANALCPECKRRCEQGEPVRRG